MPAIDNMAMTEIGRKVSRIIISPIIYYILLALCFFLDFVLSDRMKLWLAKFILKNDKVSLINSPNTKATTTVLDQQSMKQSLPDCVIKSATALFNPNCFRALILMTSYEFDQVRDPKVASIERCRDKLTILYGENDHWCPVSYYKRLRAKTSDQVDMRLCLGMVEHAFVIDPVGTNHFAKLTINIIREKVKYLFDK